MITPPVVPRAGLLRGLHTGTLVITCGVLGGLYLPLLLAHRDVYRSTAVQLAALAVLAGIAAAAGVLISRGLGWGRWRWPLVVVVLAVTVVTTAGVPPPHLVGPAHWSLGAVGWFPVLLLLERPLTQLIAVLALHTALVLAVMAVVGQFDRTSVTGLVVMSTVVLGFQVSVGAAGWALRGVAAEAARARTAAEQRRTAEAVADRVHGDRLTRYHSVVATSLPVLTGLADGRLDPADPHARRACAVEAARLRRLFAESDETDDPLVHELRAAADVAERRGVAVHLTVSGDRDPPGVDVRRALIEPALVVLAAARTRARLTVINDPSSVSVGAVADTGEAPVVAASPLVDVRTVAVDDQLYVEATWRT